MIWAIGDIHGMFGHLRKLIDLIRRYEKKDEPVEKIIFIGDYIDRGPASKEVIDLIDALDYPTVRLAGNHEDMALRFINQDQKFLLNQGNVWFNNGAIDTYISILGGKERSAVLDSVMEKYQKYRHNFQRPNEIDFYEGSELPKKYEDFLRNLQYSSREVFNIDGKEISFTFTHALPYHFFRVQEQRVTTYAQFSELVNRILRVYLMDMGGVKKADVDERRESGRFIAALERSHIWNRDYQYRRYIKKYHPVRPIVGYQGEVIIHGHTPTVHYSGHYSEYSMGDAYEQFKVYKADSYLPFIFSRTPKAGYKGKYEAPSGAKSIKNSGEFGPYSAARYCPRYVCEKWRGVEAINIDTGAFFGGALTALGLSAKYLRNGLMPILTVKRLEKDGKRVLKTRARLIKIDHFGGPRAVIYQKAENKRGS
ncbi:MAG: metallophosphoesterase [Deltaproteobacteria bacterium]|jgi:hypothetical protein|nr:metallophosphoesterase [Deltaproteobacteria bacterium]